MKHFLSFLLLTAMQPIMAQGLRLNEIMISNVDGYMVEYDFPDSWVEIFNPSDYAINIKGYSLSHLSQEQSKFTFTKSTIIPAHGYLTILCDKKGTGLHTSFRLDAEGGTLTLVSPKDSVIETLNYPAMLAPGIGYGRVPEENEIWQWEKDATPDAMNSGLFTSQLLPDPIFSMKGHVMEQPDSLYITMPEGDFPEDTKIYITYNGEEPTKDSQSGESFSLEIDKSTVIRAKLMSDNGLSPRSITQSYIFHPRKTDIPIISIVTDSIHLFDNRLGLFSGDTIFNNKPNYSQKWRRPINMEYLGLVGDTAWFNQLGETALSGASSRAKTQKSLKLISNKRFGTKHLKGAFWSDKPSLSINKSILLRNGGSTTNTYRITDGFVQTLFGTHVQHLDWQAYTPAIVYLNGEYYGISGLRERSDENYVWAHYGGEENIVLVERPFNNPQYPQFVEFEQIYQNESSTYHDIDSLMDMEQFANYLALQIYSANTDWPVHNISLWRPIEGGKWRWITKDVDYCGIPFKENMLTDILNFDSFKFLTISGEPTSQEYKRATENSNWEKSMSLFKKVLPMPEFEQIFVDRFATYLGDFLKPSVSQSLLCDMRDEILTELGATWKKHLNRDNTNSFTNFINKTLSFIAQRPRVLYQQMAEFYQLGRVIPMTLSHKDCETSINGIALTEGDFDGCYFTNRELRIRSSIKNIGWKMKFYQHNEAEAIDEYIFNNPAVSLYLRDYPDCDSVAFESFKISESEFEEKLKELAISQSECTDWSTQGEIVLNEPNYAYANITVDSLPQTKYDDLHASIDFYDNDGNYFKKPILLNLQGNSENPKLNLSIAFCDEQWTDKEAPGLTFGKWVEQDEFHLKAFYEDGLRGIAEVSYKLYSQMVANNDSIESAGIPSAFPMSLYINGDYYGMMSWQLKKHRKNMNLAKDDAKCVWIDGTLNDKQIFRGTINWEKFEVRNPKNLYNMDGTVYNGDFPQEIIDEASSAFTGKKKMVRCAEAKQYIKNLSSYYDSLTLMETNLVPEEQIKAEIEERFDVKTMVNYLVFSLVTNNYDGFSKNWQWFTRDGKRWSVAPYDCNLTFGYNEEGDSLWSASKGSKKYDFKLENVDSNGPMHWIKKYYWNDVENCYSELRMCGIIEEENIISLVREWSNRIGWENYSEEFEKWNGSPIQNDNDERISKWICERISLLDEYLRFNTTGISFLGTKDNVHSKQECYSVLGIPNVKTYKGIYIVRDDKGKMQKVIY